MSNGTAYRRVKLAVQRIAAPCHVLVGADQYVTGFVEIRDRRFADLHDRQLRKRGRRAVQRFIVRCVDACRRRAKQREAGTEPVV